MQRSFSFNIVLDSFWGFFWLFSPLPVLSCPESQTLPSVFQQSIVLHAKGTNITYYGIAFPIHGTIYHLPQLFEGKSITYYTIQCHELLHSWISPVWDIHPFSVSCGDIYIIIIFVCKLCYSLFSLSPHPSLSSPSLSVSLSLPSPPFIHHSTAPHRRPDPLNYQPSAIPTMHANPNFSRGTPGRSTYAYGTRRPPPVSALARYEGTPTSEASSQPSPGPTGGSFFKRLIPSRFSRRYENCSRTYMYVAEALSVSMYASFWFSAVLRVHVHVHISFCKYFHPPPTTTSLFHTPSSLLSLSLPLSLPLPSSPFTGALKRNLVPFVSRGA